MIIKRKSNGKQFTITPEEWNTIVGTGMSYKYDIIADDKPVEIKRLKDENLKKEKPTKKIDA